MLLKTTPRPLLSQATARAVDAANISRARKVDKAAFLDSAFDREMLLGKTFSGGGDGRQN